MGVGLTINGLTVLLRNRNTRDAHPKRREAGQREVT